MCGSRQGSNDHIIEAVGRVAGGSAAEQNEFPHQVRLSHNGATFCGGTIIDTLFILTAAHCLWLRRQRSTKNLLVIAGDHNRFITEGTEQNRTLSHVYYHENYNNETLENDIALLVLSQPFEFNNYVNSIRYPRAETTQYEGEAIVSGWGKLNEAANYAEVLQKVSLPFVSKRACQKMYQRTNNKVTNKMLCAGSPGKDSCNGDSGGPLMCQERVTGETVLCGVVSFGLRICGLPEYPGVYTDVAHYWQWIDLTIAKHKHCGNLFNVGHTRSGNYWMPKNSTQKASIDVT